MVQRFSGRQVAALAIALAALGGCKKNTVSIQAASICAMPDNCEFAATCGAFFSGPAQLDTAGGVPLILGVELHNQLADNADPTLGQVNTHDAHLESYSVTYSGDFAGSDGFTTYQTIPAGGTAVAVVYLFTGTLSSSGSGLGRASITLQGSYDNSNSWQTSFDFPVVLCAGCAPVVGCAGGVAPTASCPSEFQSPAGVTCP